MKEYNCLGCGTACKRGYSKKNKYCSNACQGKHRWSTVTVPRIERGEGAEIQTLKKYIIERFGEACVECGVGKIWNGKPITLHVDHIDGNSDNNVIQNLRLMCPNCHSQTETYGSKGLGNRYKKDTKRNSYIRNYHRAAGLRG